MAWRPSPGPAKGIGRATALALAHDGADLVLGARSASRLDALCAEVGAATGRQDIAVRSTIAETVRYLATPRSVCVTGVSIDVNDGHWLP